MACGGSGPGLTESDTRDIRNGVLSKQAADGRLLRNGAVLCTASAIATAVDSTERKLVMSAAHCFANDVDLARSVYVSNWEFEFTNVDGKPRIALGKLWMSQPGDQVCTPKYGDLAIADFGSCTSELPANAFSAITTKSLAMDDEVTLHGVRQQTSTGANAAGDKNGSIYEATVKVTDVAGYQADVAGIQLYAMDSGGRDSLCSGAAAAVNAASDPSAGTSWLSVVTSKTIADLLGGAVAPATIAGDSCSDAPPKNPFVMKK
jgi:hypothetical protein